MNLYKTQQICEQVNGLFLNVLTDYCKQCGKPNIPTDLSFINNGDCYVWAALVLSLLRHQKIPAKVVGQPSHVYIKAGDYYFDSFFTIGTKDPFDISENAVNLDRLTGYSYRKLDRIYGGLLSYKLELLLKLVPKESQWVPTIQNILKGL